MGEGSYFVEIKERVRVFRFLYFSCLCWFGLLFLVVFNFFLFSYDLLCISELGYRVLELNRREF